MCSGAYVCTPTHETIILSYALYQVHAPLVSEEVDFAQNKSHTEIILLVFEVPQIFCLPTLFSSSLILAMCEID